MSLSNRKKTGIGCFVLAVLLLGSGIKTTFFGPGLPNDTIPGLEVSRAVGVFLPSVVACSVGLWLYQNPKPKSSNP